MKPDCQLYPRSNMVRVHPRPIINLLATYEEQQLITLNFLKHVIYWTDIKYTDLYVLRKKKRYL